MCSTLARLARGHTLKLLNNFFGMTIANAMSEVFAMADKTGLGTPSPFMMLCRRGLLAL